MNILFRGTWGAAMGLLLAGCGGESIREPAGDDAATGGPVHAPPGATKSDWPDELDGAGGDGSSAAPQLPSEGPDAGAEPPKGVKDDAAVRLAGPRAEYVVATFRASSGPSSEVGSGWIDAYSLLGDGVEVGVAQGEAAAAALVDAEGRLVDAGVATCASSSFDDPSVLSVPGDHATIQAALDAASPGDTVLVSPGVYNEHLRLRSFVKLLGAGARDTILDGRGEPRNLIDFTGATSAVVSGFTLKNVGETEVCSSSDPTACSGNWYAAAVYGEGGDVTCESQSSLFFTRNVVAGTGIGVLLYFHARAVVVNNLFVSNKHALVANHHQDHSLVAHNVFYDNTDAAVIAQASHLSVLGNVMVGNGTAFGQEYIQRGFVGCNVLFDNDTTGEGFQSGGYVELNPRFVDAAGFDFRLTSESQASGHGCLGTDHDLATNPGAFGGPLGGWSP